MFGYQVCHVCAQLEHVFLSPVYAYMKMMVLLRGFCICPLQMFEYTVMISNSLGTATQFNPTKAFYQINHFKFKTDLFPSLVAKNKLCCSRLLLK